MAATPEPIAPTPEEPQSKPPVRYREVATFVIALIVVVGFFVFTFKFWNAIAKDQQGIIIGVMLGAFTSAVGYYVSSSIGSAAKSAEIKK